MGLAEQIKLKVALKSIKVMSSNQKEYYDNLHSIKMNNYGEMFKLMVAIKAARMISHSWKEYVENLDSTLAFWNIGDKHVVL